ncbi:hypothetical protein E3O25_14020 [Cryobacterium sp. TMT1-3]|uniref:IrrE N-terminal-like domain-containing protein n=1 Tax=Cryobacterium luteum TaxID=1424661 RepID=A0A1H8JD52_9MICO|nr:MULTISPECIES: hypothetical protein [Cryobacterium]TFB92327.1 hypothetical protein E3O10_04605 [Cryobacterium luteum]TFC25118.1 hypothetical protein E3O25_14020 [Cryobacterium sp. TMT1-3]SEN78700.1 hypothetical protein SAMN05216281_11446 [Cryobacterium luteum]
MDYASRQKQAHTMVAALNLPRPLTADLLHQHMETMRGKKIVVQTATPRMLEAGLCGLWIAVAGESFERIHHAPTSSVVHRQQFINHEFGHMILDQEQELISAERVALLAPLIPLDAIAYALSRSQFTDEQEALAEAIGDQLALMMLHDGPEAAHGTQTGFGRVL